MSSRRKQGRPQQRKILDSVEAENDLLVCGHCQTSFALHDIVHFIKHKNHACSKENLALALNNNHHRHHDNDHDDDEDNNDEDDEEGPTDLSQPLGSRGGKMEEEGGKPGGGKDGSWVEKEMRKPLRPRQVVDAEANTTHSEPSRFVCEACGLTVSSAWGLLQHAQKEHGMRIYNTGPGTGTGTVPATFLTTPQPAHTRPVPQAMPAHQRTPEVTSTSQKTERPSAPSSAGTGPTASFPGVLNPAFFRLPSTPFTRTSELHIPVDVLEQYRLQPHLLSTVGVTISRAAVESPIAHAAFDRTRPLDSQQTYSQRLKELANPTLTATLIAPQTTTPFTPPPVLKPLQPNAQDGSSARAGRDSTGSSGNSGSTVQQGEVKVVVVEEKRKEKATAKEKNECSPISKLSSAVSMHLPGKLKTCEFCQKKFRFQSNLIVHRRSHTGEKPFQCPLCPHACSQQSKLRRHMKTHSNGARNASLTSNTTVSSDGSTHSTSSSPDSTRHKLDDVSDMDDDEDVDIEEDDEEEDMDEDFTDGDYDSDMDKGCDNGFNPLTAESDGRSDVCSNSQADTPDAEQAPTPTKRSTSVISEVMKHSGLNCIQSYNEAFQAAWEENIGKDGAQDLSCKENGESEELKAPANGKTQSGSNKTVKDESAETGSQETGLSSGIFSPSTFPRCLPADCSSSPFRTFFPGFPPTAFTLQTVEGSGDKQSSSSSPGVLAVSDSALKVPSASSVSVTKPVSGASLLAASSGNSPLARKSGGRNDTCEYCGKVFKNCSNLTVHRRSHTGEKPYKCELCTYACAQSSKLTRHMKTHGRVGKDVFRCRFCDMPFSVPSTLEKHMRKCVENRNSRPLTSPGKEEDGEGVKMMEQDSGSQSSPVPSSMPTLSAQLQKQVSDAKIPVAQDNVQAENTSPDQSASSAVTSPAAVKEEPAKDPSSEDGMEEAEPEQA